MLNVMSKILCQIQRTCVKKRKLQLITIIQFYFSQTKFVPMQIKIKEKALLNILMKQFSKLVSPLEFSLCSFIFVQIGILKSMARNNINLCFSVSDANPQARMLLDTTGKYPRTVTPFIIKQHNILQMCSFSCCLRFVVIAAQIYSSLCISSFSLKKSSEPLISISLMS